MYNNQACGYGSCNNSYSCSNSYAANPLQDYSAEQMYTRKSASVEAAKTLPEYSTLQGAYLIKQTEPEELFLNPNRPLTKQINKEDEIMPFVKEAFEKTTGKEFPSDFIKIVVLNEDAFQEVHEANNGSYNQGVQGFAINRNGKGINEIFVKRNNLDSLMLTIGHEIGHVLSYTLSNEQDEEAKAFAFSMSWMQTIRKNNIAGIANSINPRPANNGVHDKAFEFVIEEAEKGIKSKEIFEKLCKGELSIKNRLELV